MDYVPVKSFSEKPPIQGTLKALKESSFIFTYTKDSVTLCRFLQYQVTIRG